MSHTMCAWCCQPAVVVHTFTSCSRGQVSRDAGRRARLEERRERAAGALRALRARTERRWHPRGQGVGRLDVLRRDPRGRSIAEIRSRICRASPEQVVQSDIPRNPVKLSNYLVQYVIVTQRAPPAAAP